jgi:SAM-dependent methyltransferase
MTDKTHKDLVGAQFGPRAKAYVESAVHSRGPDLDALELIVRDIAPSRALDLGCGGGHVAYLLARHARKVTATDLSSEMLAAVAETATSRALHNIETAEASADRLPFEDGTFDFLACRYSAHHWRDFEGGVREARRVLQRGATAAFIDVVAPAHPLLDTHLQVVELLRDTSHVRDYNAAEWIAAVGRSGFALNSYRTWRVRMDFPVWIARMRTPELHAVAIRSLQDAASTEIRTHFSIEPDGSFMLDVHMLEMTAA